MVHHQDLYKYALFINIFASLIAEKQQLDFEKCFHTFRQCKPVIVLLPFMCSVVLRTGDTSVMKLDDGGGGGAGAGANACSGINTEEKQISKLNNKFAI